MWQHWLSFITSLFGSKKNRSAIFYKILFGFLKSQKLITMSELPYGPPVRVSPLIRFGRWSFLGVGILYGAFHQNRLSKKEAKVREIEAKEKVVRDEKLKKEKLIAAAAEIKALEELASPVKK